jgi:hypothetical protein
VAAQTTARYFESRRKRFRSPVTNFGSVQDYVAGIYLSVLMPKQIITNDTRDAGQFDRRFQKTTSCLANKRLDSPSANGWVRACALGGTQPIRETTIAIHARHSLATT